MEMKREIKFRAWDKQGKRFVPDVYEEDPFEIYLDGTYLGMTGFDWEGAERFDIMQYTGIKDTDGKEIWEGDIVKDRRSVGVVIYNAPYFDAEWKVGPVRYDYDNALMYGVEVIGNIYENPELLESKNGTCRKENRIPG